MSLGLLPDQQECPTTSVLALLAAGKPPATTTERLRIKAHLARCHECKGKFIFMSACLGPIRARSFRPDAALGAFAGRRRRRTTVRGTVAMTSATLLALGAFFAASSGSRWDRRVPAAAAGSPTRQTAIAVEIAIKPPRSLRPGPIGLARLEGRVFGVNGQSNLKAIPFAYVKPGNGNDPPTWYVEPEIENPGCPVRSDGAFTCLTRGGDRYGLVVARRQYQPPIHATSLPAAGGDVLAVQEFDPR